MRDIKQVRLELFLASFIVLFQELTFIRWLPAKVRVLAYFPNLILISAFLGLGVGCLRARKSSLLWLWPVSLAFLILGAIAGSEIAFTQESISEHLWLLYYDLPKDALVFNDVRTPIIICFLLSCISFIPLGQIVADRLQEFKRLSSSLLGYCWDIFGSLIGVVSFSFLGFMQVFPVYWFLIYFVIGLLFFYKKPRLNIAYIIAIFVITLFIAKNEKATHYSPYYAISYTNIKGSFLKILTNGSLHQIGLNLNDVTYSKSEENIQLREGYNLPYHHAKLHIHEGYHLPYRHLKKIPKKALVIGAGTGNDVAVMLSEGIEQIDAVEIDPVILELGRKMHPHQPYHSNRVRIFNTDARSFLNNTTEKYDLIVFGTLDSMTRLSALSNIRLDNFVYTLESIEAAKAILNPGGGMVMYFMVPTQFIHQKIFSILTEVFNQAPAIISKHYLLFNHIYMAGPAFDHEHGNSRREMVVDFKKSIMNKLDVPSDDWPYLYLNKRGINSFYLSLIGGIILIALLLISAASGEMRRSILTGKAIDSQMIFFGLAFLLLETRYITQMNLIWGATWITSAVVFGSILGMVLFSTILARLRPFPLYISAICLVLTLIASYFLPNELLLRQGVWMKFLLSVLVVGTPIFFAGTCFALLFEKRERADLAFGWNLIGAVVGGLSEFLTMRIGFKNLLLLSVTIYLLAFILYIREERARGIRKMETHQV